MRFVLVVDGCIRLFSKLRPIWFKRLILSRLFDLFACVLRLKSLLSQLHVHVYVVSGIEKQTSELIRLLFVGGKRFPVFLDELIFKETPTVEHVGKICIWRIKHLKKRYVDTVDAVLVSCDQLYVRFLFQDDFFVFPHMVDMVLDTSRSLKELLGGLPHSTLEDVKKVKKNQFSFGISSDVKKLYTFYYEMYLPTLKNRIGETDVFTPDFVFLKYLKECGYELMMITYKGKEVCGVFFQQKDDVLLLKYAGVLQGDTALIKKGVFSAFYYFFMIYAKEHYVNRIDFEGVRPFFNDGLFQYKQKWGMVVEPYGLLKEMFGLRIITVSEPLKRFLMHNPFIGLNDKAELVCFVFSDHDLDDKEKKRFEKRFYISNIQKVEFITLK